MASRQQRDENARFQILEAYARAKKANPKLTQAQFMMEGSPATHFKGAPGKFNSPDAAARYFRKIQSGERTGGAMIRAQEGQVGLYQIRAKLSDDKIISQNMTVAGGRTTFDIPAIERELKKNHKANVERLVAQHRAKYGQEAAEFDWDDITVRRIRSQRKPIRMRLQL